MFRRFCYFVILLFVFTFFCLCATKVVCAAEGENITITFNARTGNNTDNTTVTIKSGTSLGSNLPNDPTKPDCNFDGWFTEEVGGVSINASTVFTKNTTLYAHWDCDVGGPTGEVTVSLNADGGLVSPTSVGVIAGETIGTLPNPSKTDCNFLGWFTNDGVKIDSSTIVAGNVTLYAHWDCDEIVEGETITITFDARNGNPTTSLTIKAGASLSSLSTPTKPDCNFIAWFTDEVGGVSVDTSTIFTKNTTLYAHWDCDVGGPTGKVTVSLDAAGGSVDTNSLSVTIGNEGFGNLTTLPTPTKPDCEFLGWFTSGGVKVDSSAKIAGNVTLYAHWDCDEVVEGETITITFDANGGTFTDGKTTKTLTIQSGTSISYLPTPIQPDCEFLGWFTGVSGGSNVNSSTVLTEDMTVYAHWNCDEVVGDDRIVVYFDANGGTVSPSSLSLNIGDRIGNLPTPSRSGYVFEGWYTSSGSKVTTNAKVNGNITLYAKWIKESDLYSGKTSEQPSNNAKTGDSEIYLVIGLLIMSVGYLIYYFGYKKYTFQV